MKIFDKEFDVKLIEYADMSKPQNPHTVVKFLVDGEMYIYTYTGGGLMALGYVNKIDEHGYMTPIYDPFKHIENGSYYEEIGRQLSISQRN